MNVSNAIAARKKGNCIQDSQVTLLYQYIRIIPGLVTPDGEQFITIKIDGIDVR